MGLRWEAHPGPATDGLVQAFDLQNKAVVMEKPIQSYVDRGYTNAGVIQNLNNLGVRFELPSEAHLPSHIFKNYYNLVSPRIGFAYAPWGTHGFVLRAGYGRYIYPRPTRNSVATAVVTNEPFSATYTQSYVSGNTPDGLNNYWLRHPISIVAGQNSSNAVDTNQVTGLTPGVAWTTLNPNDAPQFVQQFALTGEQPLPGESVLRVSYVYNHGTNLDQAHRYNQTVSDYLWYKRTGLAKPTGTYAAVALNPYDSTTYGGNIQINPTGLSTNNSMQVNYQHLYKHGYAYQIYYVYSAAFRIGGNSTRDSFVYPVEDYDASVLPTDTSYKGMNRWENYIRDTGIPKHHIGFNGVVDLPFGRHKKFFSNTPTWLNEIVGGFQIAGVGNITSQSFAVGTANWGATSPLKVYRDSAPINDCRSSTTSATVCYPAHLWFNGFNLPGLYGGKTSGGAQCGAQISHFDGIPADYTPYSSPITTSCAASNNNVIGGVPLKNGTIQTVAYLPGQVGANPFTHTVLSGPIRWSADASIFKVFPIHDAVSMRMNLDAFNVFNVQGYVNPDGTTGIQNLQAAANTARRLQLSVRLTF